MPTREDAWKIVCEFTESESLRKHMLAVETCVRAYARKNGADETTWGLAALLHDFDYERWPNADHAADREHPAEGARILRERGYSEEIVRAILSHAEYSGVPRQSALEHSAGQRHSITPAALGAGGRGGQELVDVVGDVVVQA